jgi:hypothetical protein
MIRHAGLGSAAAAVAIEALAVAVIEASFGAGLVAAVGFAALLQTCDVAALEAAIAVSAVAVGADVEEGLAVRRQAPSPQENDFVGVCRHAGRQTGLDNGRPFVAV